MLDGVCTATMAKTHWQPVITEPADLGAKSPQNYTFFKFARVGKYPANLIEVVC